MPRFWLEWIVFAILVPAQLICPTRCDRKLQKIWRWTNERQPFKYQGQGQHSIKVGDIDGDGFDEILDGSIAIDNDGRTIWSTGLGHGDRFYLSDIDPDRPGLEVWYTIEDPHPQNGVSLWDAKTRHAHLRPEPAEQRQSDRRRPRRRPRRDRSAGDPHAGSAVPARRDAPLDGVSARAADELLPRRHDPQNTPCEAVTALVGDR
jgi:hypothetical protein